MWNRERRRCLLTLIQVDHITVQTISLELLSVWNDMRIESPKILYANHMSRCIMEFTKSELKKNVITNFDNIQLKLYSSFLMQKKLILTKSYYVKLLLMLLLFFCFFQSYYVIIFYILFMVIIITIIITINKIWCFHNVHYVSLNLS